MKCIQCGRCCKKRDPVSVTQSDYERLGHLSHYIDVDYHGQTQGYYMIKRENGCPFLAKDGTKYKCIIHSIRPDVCRAFVPGGPHAKDYSCCPVNIPIGQNTKVRPGVVVQAVRSV